MYQLVIILKSINEIALMALIGQGALYLLAGAKRDGNVVYFILKTMTMPVFKFARWITPRVILDQHLGWVALFIVLLAEVLLISAKITLHVQAASGG
jgi:NADH:ubiquinone oxidoreductase subunit H